MGSILTVGELNRYLSTALKMDKRLHGKQIEGEISNLLLHSKSGHMYFTLKDREASIKAVMFRENAQRLKFLPENGMYVVVSGSIQFYERDGVCQIYATNLVPYGAGAQSLALMELKEKLEAEGLFDPKRKKPLPQYPKRIGVVTAKGGAAIQDILRIIERRWPVAEVLLFSAFVQGDRAVKSICEGISAAQNENCDVIIVGRGGGSSEDLSAFQQELVVRAIAGSKVPVISAVGHETDTTLSDLAADLRAPTPSAAAELSVPDRREVSGKISALEKGIGAAFEKELSFKNTALTWRKKQLIALSAEKKIFASRESLLGKSALLEEYFRRAIFEKEKELSVRCAALSALNPMEVLAKGFAVVSQNGRLVTRASEVLEEAPLRIRFQDGEIMAAPLKGKE